MAAASLVLGIISLVFAFIPILNFISPVTGVIGIVFGAVSLKNLRSRNMPTGMAAGGLVTSIIGVAFGAIVYIACFACSLGTSCMATNCASRVRHDMQNRGNIQAPAPSHNSPGKLKEDRDKPDHLKKLDKKLREMDRNIL